jgi:hypothetical protein
MARSETRACAERVYDALEYFRINKAHKEDVIDSITDTLDDLLSDYITKRARKPDNPIGELMLAVNKGDYVAALPCVNTVNNPDLAEVIRTLLGALTDGTAQELCEQRISDL